LPEAGKNASVLRIPGGLMNELIEGPRRSKLTFVASCDPTARVEVGQLRRVREPVSRSKSGVQGKVSDVVRGRSRHAESQNELKAFQVLLATGHADAWQEQPFVLEYHDDGKRHRYTPDILVAWGANREVVEIKEDSEAAKPENRARFALVRDLLAEHGYSFRVWTRSEICAEPRLTNVGLVLRYRCVDIPAAEREKIRRAFSSGAELTLRKVNETPAVLRLVLDGILHIDWWEPLRLDSRVSGTAIGRQIWPVPPGCRLQEERCH
jgi:hypothetical protein